MNASVIASLLLINAGTINGSKSDFAFPRTTDPGGCIIELVASSEDRNHHQFDGFSWILTNGL